jgi:hypothetical protein
MRKRCVGYIAQIGKRETHIGYLLARKPEGRKPLGRSRRRWEDYIKIALGGMGWGGLDWSGFE